MNETTTADENTEQRLRRLRQMRAWLDAEIALLAGQTQEQLLNPVTRAIIAQAATLYDVDIEDLTGTRKDAHLARARHAACWLLRRHGLTYAEIGRVMERDHTTALHAVRRVDSNAAMVALLRNVKDPGSMAEAVA